MAVFLVNQCTFSKLPNANNDQQANANNLSNGACCQSGQNPSDSVGQVGGNAVGHLAVSSNICGLKFDSLFELIHHIEDNHITDVDYSPGIHAGPFYAPQQQPSSQQTVTGAIQQPQPHHHLPTHAGMVPAPNPIRDSNIYNVIPHDRHHLSQIINGGWLPTSCILRIFNSTHKTHKPQPIQQQQPQPQQQQIPLQTQQQLPTHQLMHKLQASQHHLSPALQQPQQLQQISQTPPPQVQQQQIKYESGVVMSQSQDSQVTNVIAPLGATHMAPQMAVGIHPQQMIAVQLAQPPMQQMTVPPQQQIQTLPQAQVQVQAQPQLQTQVQQHATLQHPTQQPNLHPPQQQQQLLQQQQSQITQIINSPQPQQQAISNSIQQPVASPAPVVTNTPKPTKVYKCTDCSKTYKTQHGLRTHQTTHHPNTPLNDGKIMAIMPEGGDNSSGSPAHMYQQQQQQPVTVDIKPTTQPSQIGQQTTLSNSIQQQMVPSPAVTSPAMVSPAVAASPGVASPQVSTPKPTKVYKCTDCSKTYKTQHGLRTHQTTHHPNTPLTDGKIMATVQEGGDTSSGSPAQQQTQQQQSMPSQQPATQQPQQQQQQVTVNHIKM